ncbi:MAG: hypothetical protein P4L84_19505 [Isosphaeraceae bacterium]|nr:hypothetical protein [Isosphaeraceae bacterium]
MNTRLTRLAGTLGVALSLTLAAVAGDAPKPTRSAPKAGEEAPANLIPPGAKNLLPNGDFEAGTLTPDGWQTVDGLSSFWIQDDDPAHAKVLRFDTDILQSQGYDWWVKVAQGASPKDAPKKQATVEPKYDTLAGLDGVWFWSDPVPVEKGKAYWLTLDVKGPPLLVWLVGYPEKPDTAFGVDEAAFQEVLKARRTGKEPDTSRKREVFVHKYVWKGQLAAGGADRWKTYARRAKPFRPTAATPSVKYVRVLIYPFWPPAAYAVDNVRLVALDEPPPAP